MTNLQGIEAQIERVDDLPLLYGLLKQMGIQSVVDSVIEPHGNWQGLSAGRVITIWLLHILSEQSHLMEPVQDWVQKHLVMLRGLSHRRLAVLDFSDDRLALCLHYLYASANWQAIEERLGVRLIRVYDLQKSLLRLDASVNTVSHDPEKHTLFQVGKAKNGLYETQFKTMLASLDPLGLPVAVDVVVGNRADDPLYVPIYLRAKSILACSGLLVVGDCKMSALLTRGTMVAGQDRYLTPLDYLKSDPALLSNLLTEWQARAELPTLVCLPEEMPAAGSLPDPSLAIAAGFEVKRIQNTTVDGLSVTWAERLLVVRSFSYVKSMQTSLHQRLDKAEAALRDLTPSRQRGKRQIADEASLRSAIERIEKQYRVRGLFDLDFDCQRSERQVRGYQGQPPRVERQVRYQLHIARNAQAIAAAEFEAGWRIYVTNAPADSLCLSQAVLAYRDQYIEENIFRRLQGKFLSITPLYIQRDDHAQGLVHLLSLAARLLALGDYLARQALAKQADVLSGIYAGNPKRGTARPTTERMLRAFKGIDLLILHTADQAAHFLTALSPVQKRILELLGLDLSIYNDLQSA